MNAEIKTKLRMKAMQATVPFCYSCYTNCPKGRCPQCGNDDLMKCMPGYGIEYGVDWVFEHLVDDLESVETEELFENMMKGTYQEAAKVGPIEVDVVSILKEQTAWWRSAKSDYIDDLVAEEELTEIGGKYYWTSDLEDHL